MRFRSHSGTEKLKNSRQKNSWNQINHFFFSWNCISGSLNRIWSKYFFVKLICLISRVFSLDFLKFSVPLCSRPSQYLITFLWFLFSRSESNDSSAEESSEDERKSKKKKQSKKIKSEDDEDMEKLPKKKSKSAFKHPFPELMTIGKP